MKLQNNGEEFILYFQAREIEIPEGKFTVNEEELANHIMYVAGKWGKDVKNITIAKGKTIEKDETPEDIIAEDDIVKEEAPVKEEPKKEEEKKEEVKKEPKKDFKGSKKINKAQNSL